MNIDAIRKRFDKWWHSDYAGGKMWEYVDMSERDALNVWEAATKAAADICREISDKFDNVTARTEYTDGIARGAEKGCEAILGET